MSCKNIAFQMVPYGYGYKQIESQCGTTGIHGEQILCDECYKKAELKYPHGWVSVPGDLCKHGTYVGDASGPDFICGYCEEEE